jgi:hypothetical protein
VELPLQLHHLGGLVGSGDGSLGGQ